MGYVVKAVVADAEQIEKLIAKHYKTGTEAITDILGELNNDQTLKDLKGRAGAETIDLDSLKEAADSNPVRKLINLVLLQAIKDKASDIHFEPFEDEFKMRYRIDGILYEMMPPPAHIAPAIASRIKVMANLDIAERRVPQDGRIELNVNNLPIDLRVSVLPTMFGESVVMRVLDRSNVQLDLVYQCEGDSLAACADDRYDLRAGKRFLAASANRIYFHPIETDIREAFRYRTQFAARSGIFRSMPLEAPIVPGLAGFAKRARGDGLVRNRYSIRMNLAL
jgi:hypothetical protein